MRERSVDENEIEDGEEEPGIVLAMYSVQCGLRGDASCD